MSAEGRAAAHALQRLVQVPSSHVFRQLAPEQKKTQWPPLQPFVQVAPGRHWILQPPPLQSNVHNAPDAQRIEQSPPEHVELQMPALHALVQLPTEHVVLQTPPVHSHEVSAPDAHGASFSFESEPLLQVLLPPPPSLVEVDTR